MAYSAGFSGHSCRFKSLELKEQMQNNLLFCWFFGLWIDGPVCAPTVFRERLIPRGPGVTLQVDIDEIAVGGASDGMITHQGVEMGSALEGVVDLIVEGLLRRLEAGDSFCFR
jgi:hypothetical protein